MKKYELLTAGAVRLGSRELYLVRALRDFGEVWNTVYLDQAAKHLRTRGVGISDEHLAHVAPLGWEHISLTGDYVWADAIPPEKLRPLRDINNSVLALAA